MRQGTTVRRRFFQWLVALVAVTIPVAMAVACSVPVFRYALEHWRPDAYVVYVFHDNGLTSEQQAIVDSLQSTPKMHANIAVQVVAVDASVDDAGNRAWAALVEQESTAPSLPRLVLQSPPKWGPPQTIWHGELNQQNAKGIIDSPLRQQINKLLVDGESVVWVLLECGDKAADDAAFEVLSAELEKLEKTIELPEIETEDLGDLSVDPNALKVAFSALRVSRDNPQEQVLVEMLQRVEPDLMDEELASQPMAFPIFGRGRALYALIGRGIGPLPITDASKFLAGACQCTVKAQNPGVDLVMNVNWEEVVEPIEVLDEGLPPLAGFSGFVESLDDNGGNGEQAENSSASTAPTSVAGDEAPTESSADESSAAASTTAKPPGDSTQIAAVDASQPTATETSESANAADASGGVIDSPPVRFRLSLTLWFAIGAVVIGVVIASLVLIPRSE